MSYARAVDLIEYWAEPDEAQDGGKPMSAGEFMSAFGSAGGG